MEIYAITEEDYNLLDLPSSPYSLEEVPANTKDLLLSMYSLYMKFFTEYLIKNTILGELDNSLSDNKVIHSIKDEHKDTYQLLNNNMLKHLYIRNNLYLDRLTKEEMDILTNKILNNDYNYDDDIERFISKTYKKITYEEVDTNGVLVNYGPFTNNFFAPSNSLVIGFRCENTYDMDELIEQYQIYDNIKLKLEEDMQNKLGYNVTVLRYDNMSVKKKTTKMNNK